MSDNHSDMYVIYYDIFISQYIAETFLNILAEGYWTANSQCGFWEEYGATFPRSTLTNYGSNDTVFDSKCDYSRNVNFFDTSQNGMNFVCDCWYILDKYMETSCCRELSNAEAILFNFLLGIIAILLWGRVLYFYETHPRLGPLLKVIGHMIDDIINYVIISFLFAIGFGLAIRAVIGDWSSQFNGVSATGLYMFKSVFMKIDFTVLNACGESANDLCQDNGWITHWRSNLAQILVCVYLVIALCMMRILVAMFAATYNKSIKESESQVAHARLKLVYELDRSSGFPPPLNIIVFTISIVWTFIDVTILLVFNRYIGFESNTDTNAEHHINIMNISKDKSRARCGVTFSKPKGNNYCDRVMNGIKILMGKLDDDTWICYYCRTPNKDSMKYPIQSYLKQFHPRNDKADEQLMEVYSPHICKTCYRSKYITIGRPQIISRKISFVVFMVICYPIIIILMFIPALISKLIQSLVKSEQKKMLQQAEKLANEERGPDPQINRELGQMEYQLRSIPNKYNVKQKKRHDMIKHIIVTKKNNANHVIPTKIDQILNTARNENKLDDLYTLVFNSSKQLAQIQQKLIEKSLTVTDQSSSAINDNDNSNDNENATK